METLESSRVCRLCGKHSGISIDIFDRNENHVRKINAVLPIMVHEMDLLPKHMCHRCSYKLEEFHKFYEDCLRTDAHLKSQLSWMRKGEATERIGVPMVHIQDLKIKVEPPDFDAFDSQPLVDNVNYLNSMSFPVNGVQPNGVSYATYPRCKYCCDKVDQSSRTASASYHNTMPVVPASTTLHEGQNGHELGTPVEFQAAKQNLSNRERRSRAAPLQETLKDTGKRKPSTSNNNPIDVTKIKRDPMEDETPSTAVVRNLRPRRKSVDYVGTKRKSSSSKSRSKSVGIKKELLPVTKVELPEIKTERVDDFEGRILRPRRMIDYVESKRSNRSSVKRKRLQSSDANTRKSKVQCVARNLSSKVSKLLGVGGLRIKQEIVDQEENMVMGGHERISNLVSLPSNVLHDVENDHRAFNKSSSSQPRDYYRVANKLKSLGHTVKKKVVSGKLELPRKTAIDYIPKFLRSQDAYLRNGKIKTVKEEPNRMTRVNRGGVEKKKGGGKKMDENQQRTQSHEVSRPEAYR